jgi:hypothetical protein
LGFGLGTLVFAFCALNDRLGPLYFELCTLYFWWNDKGKSREQRLAQNKIQRPKTKDQRPKPKQAKFKAQSTKLKVQS